MWCQLQCNLPLPRPSSLGVMIISDCKLSHACIGLHHFLYSSEILSEPSVSYLPHLFDLQFSPSLVVQSILLQNYKSTMQSERFYRQC